MPAAPLPDRCALLVVDVQNDYCHSGGALARMGQDVSGADAMLPALVRVLGAAADRRVPRIFVRTEHSEWTDTPAWLSRGAAGGRLRPTEFPVCRRGSWGADFYRVAPSDDDWVIVKHRYSAFAFTALELTLEALGRDTVLLSGTTTNVCVEATATDALTRGFRPVLVTDATSCSSADKQLASVAEFADHLGTTVTSDDLLAAWSHP